jgi:hypothetical protein
MPASKSGSVDRLAYSVEELQRLLPFGRAGAYRLARQIGIRQGRRIVIPSAMSSLGSPNPGGLRRSGPRSERGSATSRRPMRAAS